MRMGELWTDSTPDYSGGLTQADSGYVPGFDVGSLFDFGSGVTDAQPVTSSGGFSIDLGLDSWAPVLTDFAKLYASYKLQSQQIEKSGGSVSTTTRLADGSSVRRNADGSSTVTRPDGSVAIIGANGQMVVTGSNGQSVTSNIANWLNNNTMTAIFGLGIGLAVLYLLMRPRSR